MIKKEIYEFLFNNIPFTKNKEEINLGFKELLRLDLTTYLLTNNELKIKELLECNFVPNLTFNERFNIVNKITTNYINGTKIEEFTPFLYLVKKDNDLIKELDIFISKIKDLNILFYSNNIIKKTNPGSNKILLPENIFDSTTIFTSFLFTKTNNKKNRMMLSFDNAADSQYLKTLYLLLNEDLTLNEEKIYILKHLFNNEEIYNKYYKLIKDLNVIKYEEYLSKEIVKKNIDITKIITLPFQDTYIHINILHSTRGIFSLNESILNLFKERKNNPSIEMNSRKICKNLQMISKPQNLFFPAIQGNTGFYIFKNSEIYFNKKYIKNICLEESSMEDLEKLFFKIKNNMYFNKNMEKLNKIKELILNFRKEEKNDNFQYQKNIVESNLNAFIKIFFKYIFIFDQEDEIFLEKKDLFIKRLNKLIKEEFNIHNKELISNVNKIIEETVNEKLYNN